MFYDSIREYRFLADETKYINSRVESVDSNDTIVITEVAYTLKKEGTVIDSGSSTGTPPAVAVNGNEIKVLLTISHPGKYVLEETVSIGAEVYKSRVNIIVE